MLISGMEEQLKDPVRISLNFNAYIRGSNLYSVSVVYGIKSARGMSSVSFLEAYNVAKSKVEALHGVGSWEYVDKTAAVQFPQVLTT